jgi:anti-sigma factor RsiW
MAEIEEHLRGCSMCATAARELLQMKLATRVAGMLYAPSSEFRLLMQQTLHAKDKRQWWSFRLPKIATAGLAAALLISSAALLREHNANEHELTEIADLHVTDLASSNPVDVISTDRHTVKPWFAGKLPFSFDLPELQKSEFTLVGGRVAYFERSSGAQLLFSVRKHQLSVFIFQEEPRSFSLHAGTLISTRLALHMESWSEGGLRYFIVSDASSADVHALSEMLRKVAGS